ncbi:MAG: hypothetical protein JSU68_09225 [Phycisphaerales bacterium]|nr:MAG: hypothetical protein JSU68_09225 [Phycisphaerales bacterium]
MKTACSLLWLFFPAAGLAADGLVADEPAYGEWDFAAQKVWERERAGEEAFGRPAELRLTPDETLCFHDFDKQVSYIFDRDGGLVRAFGSQGRGPGEVSRYINCFTVGDKIVVGTPDTLEYFSKGGEFVRSVRNDLFARFPLVFLDEDEFLCVPGGPHETRGGKERILRRNVRTAAETEFAVLRVSSREGGQAGGAVVLGLTPQVRITHDPQTGEIYCGRNDKYAIHVFDSSGELLRNFGLKRAKVRVTDETKMEYLESLGMPKGRREALARSLPDKLACYYHIQVNDGLIYVFAVTGLDRRPSSQRIDVFRPDGTYLYRGRIGFEDGRHIYSSPENLAIRNDRLYVILEDDAGKKTLAKYQVTLPKDDA